MHLSKLLKYVFLTSCISLNKGRRWLHFNTDPPFCKQAESDFIEPATLSDEIRYILLRINFDLRRKLQLKQPSKVGVPESSSKERLNILKGRHKLLKLKERSLTPCDITGRTPNEVLHDQCDNNTRPFCKNINLALFRDLLEEFFPADPLAYEIFSRGIPLTGEVRAPKCWENKKVKHLPRRRTPQQAINKTKRWSKPDWPQELAEATYNTSIEECEPVQPMGCPLLRRIPFAELLLKAAQGVFLSIERRFPVLQANKTRMIDPRCDTNIASWQIKKLPIPSPISIAANVAAFHDPQLRKAEGYFSHTRRDLKRCAKYEAEYEQALARYINKEITEMPKKFFRISNQQLIDALVKAENSSLSETPSNNSYSPVSKKRKIQKVNTSLVVIDLEKFFKNIPIREDNLLAHIVAVFNPFTEKNEFFEGLSASFGSVHSIGNAVLISEALNTIITKLYQINGSIYIDDFTFCTHGDCEDVALEALLEFFESIGIPVKTSKIQVGKECRILGLNFYTNTDQVTIEVDAERRQKLIHLIEKVLDNLHISPTEAESLIGKLNFAFSAVHDRRYNPLVYCLTKYIQDSNKNIDIDHTTITALNSMIQILKSPMRRCVKFMHPHSIRHVLYTDASWSASSNSGILGAVLISPQGIKGRYAYVTEQMIPKAIIKGPINVLECTAAIAAINEFSSDLKQACHFDIHIDSNTAKAAFLHKSSKKAHLAALSCSFWNAVSETGTSCWIHRVPSKNPVCLNVSDYCTRPSKLLALSSCIPDFFDEFSTFSNKEVIKNCLNTVEQVTKSGISLANLDPDKDFICVQSN